MDATLRAAGIADPALIAAYQACRRINARHGKTYYLATLLLPPGKRPFVHALYGFARATDDILDSPRTGDAPIRSAALRQLRTEFESAWERGGSDVAVIHAVVDTARRWSIPHEHFTAFLDAMAMDLTVTSYATYADLRRYMYGSAAVIGLQLLPILEPTDPIAARSGAIALGEAFQLANFVRDVAEDLDRGRIYLPLDELARHGVTPKTLARRRTDDDLRAALAEQVDRVRALSQQAAATIGLLHPSVRDCVETARVLYCGIADQVAADDYAVFERRSRVPRRRRLAAAGRAFTGARRARRRFGPGAVAAPGFTAGATPAAHSAAPAAHPAGPERPMRSA